MCRGVFQTSRLEQADAARWCSWQASRMARFASRAAGPQAAHGAHRARHRSRRRDGERHLRAHRLDLDAFDTIFTDLSRHGARSRARRRSTWRRQRHASRRRSTSRCCRGEGAPRRRPARRRRRRGRAADRRRRKGDHVRRRPESRLQRRPDAARSSTRSPSSTGDWPKAGEVVVDKSTAGKKNFRSARDIGVQAQGPVERFASPGFVKFGTVSSIGGATIAGFDLPTAQTCSTRGASSTRSGSPPRPACRPRSSWRGREDPAAGHAGAHRHRAGCGGRGGHERASSPSCRSSCSRSAASRSSSARS